MGQYDQQLFQDAFTKANSNFMFRDWSSALSSLNRMAMPDMLQALSVLPQDQLDRFRNEAFPPGLTGPSVDSLRRTVFAYQVVRNFEIMDYSIPEDQVNDGREFLGCTRLSDDGVAAVILKARAEAQAMIDAGEFDKSELYNKYDCAKCCGNSLVTWRAVLVPQRTKPRASLIANVAAAAHYMLSCYTVCAGLATPFWMKRVIDSYDIKKRNAIAGGDKHLASMAQIPEAPPFPPDFGIKKWAYKGADDGLSDQLKCNSSTWVNILPVIDNRVFGIIPTITIAGGQL